MIFDAEAYAEGICEHAAGSSIEVLVDTIDATITTLGYAQAPGLRPNADRDALIERWNELRNAIVEHERASGKGTVFAPITREPEPRVTGRKAKIAAAYAEWTRIRPLVEAADVDGRRARLPDQLLKDALCLARTAKELEIQAITLWSQTHGFPPFRTKPKHNPLRTEN